MTPFIGLTAFVMSFGPPAAEIADLIRAEHWAAAQTATKQLLRGPDPHRAAGALWLLLRDRSLPGRASILSDVGTVRFAPAVPVLAELLDDPDPGVREWSARALGWVGDPSAIPALTRRLKASTDAVQTDSIRLALAKLGRPYLGYYLAGLWDRDPGRRYASFVALDALKDPRAVPHLLARLDTATDTDLIVRWALRHTTGVPEAVVLSTRTNPDGSTSSETRPRSTAEIRKDVEAWVARNREAVTRPIEPPDEPWAFTPEPELPGLGVSFAMTAAEVRKALDKAGVKYEYHPEKTDFPPGSTLSFSPESIDARQPAGFKWISGFTYVFKGGQLEEVWFFALRDDLTALVKPWRLKGDGVRGGTALDGTIRIDPMDGNAEGTSYRVRLNYRGR